MEDKIPELFKEQWIKATLKFLKNDNKLMLEYPLMPVDRMEYLRDVIWQCKNSDGIDVWEMMKIFSAKYRFKLTAYKSEDGGKGHLVLQKIPNNKPENPEQDNGVQENGYSESSDEETSDEYITESNTSQTESPAHKVIKVKSKTKNKLRRSKSEKFFIDTQKIIGSISPALLKKSLKNILDFLLAEEEASVIFSNLAPIEARFLENFLAIYNRRKSFEEYLTPACNELLNKMCKIFQVFNEQCKLEIYPAKYNVKTTKREVQFMKVPRYTRGNANQPQKKFESLQKIAENNLNTTRSLPKPNSSEISEASSFKITVSNEKTDNFNHQQNRQVKFTVEVKDNRFIDNKNAINNGVKLSNGETESHRCIDNKTFLTDNKIIQLAYSETKDNQCIDNNKDGTDNKGVKLSTCGQAINNTVKTPQVEKPTINNKKTDGASRLSTGSRKEKLLEAMSTPLESDIGLRMMRLMGWEGGALGPRGEGIVEPIIPALHIVPGKGFGHVKEAAKPNKLTKIMKVANRMALLKTILDLVRTDAKVSSVEYSVPLSNKEVTCFLNTITNINNKTPFNLTPREDAIVMKIDKVLESETGVFLNMALSEDSKKITVTKSPNRVIETKPNKRKKLLLAREIKQSTENIEEDFSTTEKKIPVKTPRAYFCSSLLDFVKSGHLAKEICFNTHLSNKFINYIHEMCYNINIRTPTDFHHGTRVYKEILEHTKGFYLQLGSKQNGSVTLRKLPYGKHNDNIEVKHDVNNSTVNTIPDIDNITDKANKNKDKETNKLNAEADCIANKATSSKINNLNVYKENTSQQFRLTNEINNVDSTVSYIFVDSVRNSFVCSEENSENTQKSIRTDEYNEIEKYISKTDKLNDKVYTLNNNCKPSDHFVSNSNGVNEQSKKLVEIKLRDAKRITLIAQFNDFGRVDKDLIRMTINSLTSHENSDLHTINDNLKYTETSKLSEKLDVFCESSDNNSRKWYELSEKFLKHGDLVKSKLNTTAEKNYIKSNTDNTKTHYKIDDETDSKISHEVVEKHSELDTGKNTLEVGSNNKGIIDITDSKESKIVNYNRNKIETSNEVDLSVYKTEVLDSESELHINQIEPSKDLKSKSESEALDSDEFYDAVEIKPTEYDREEVMNKLHKTVQISSSLDKIKVKPDLNKDVKRENENKMKDFNVSNNAITENNRNCHKILLIDSNITGLEIIQKKVQNLIENMDFENERLPLFKYHGVLDKAVVYSCHTEDSCLWLKGALSDYKIIDYKSAVHNHKVKISVASFNSDAKKVFKLLEAYNKGLKCCNWRIVFGKYFHCLLTLVVEMDDVSFEYICDNNFNLFVGYGVAQFTIGC